jgi:glycine C-acetyltransferase
MSIKLLDRPSGKKLLNSSRKNIGYFKKQIEKINIPFAAGSVHPIQPVLIADPIKCKFLVDRLFKYGILVTSINYPVVPKGRDEIRVQISAVHTKKDIDLLVSMFKLFFK